MPESIESTLPAFGQFGIFGTRCTVLVVPTEEVITIFHRSWDGIIACDSVWKISRDTLSYAICVSPLLWFTCGSEVSCFWPCITLSTTVQEALHSITPSSLHTVSSRIICQSNTLLSRYFLDIITHPFETRLAIGHDLASFGHKGSHSGDLLISALLVVVRSIIRLQLAPKLSVSRNFTARNDTTIEHPFHVWIQCRSGVRLCTCTSSYENLGIGSSVSSYSNFLYEIFVAFAVYIDFVFTRSEVVINEHTVVVVISSINSLAHEVTSYVFVRVSFDEFTFCVTEHNARTVDWIVNIVRRTTRVVSLVDLFILGTDITHDITLGILSTTVHFGETTPIAKTLLTAPVRLHSTVTSWLVSVEITLNQCTWI